MLSSKTGLAVSFGRYEHFVNPQNREFFLLIILVLNRKIECRKRSGNVLEGQNVDKMLRVRYGKYRDRRDCKKPLKNIVCGFHF